MARRHESFNYEMIDDRVAIGAPIRIVLCLQGFEYGRLTVTIGPVAGIEALRAFLRIRNPTQRLSVIEAERSQHLPTM